MMTDENEILYQPIASLHRMLIEGELSAPELTQLFLKQIKAHNDAYHVFLTVTEEEALRAANRAQALIEGGECYHPLLGVPVAISDLLHLKGYPTTLGFIRANGHSDEFDSPEVERIKDAGGIIVGKTNLPQFDLNDNTENQLCAACANPWDDSRCVGGSGAAAAVALGMASVAVGSDFWGDARLSSAFCGTVACKPTRWLSYQPKDTKIPYSLRKFSQRAPIARSVKDLAITHSVLTAGQEGDVLLESERTLRIGYSRDLGFLPISARIQHVVDEAVGALKDNGHELVEVDLDLNDDLLIHFRNIVAADLFAPILSISKGARMPELVRQTQEWLMVGDRVTGVQYSMALSYARWLREYLDTQFSEFDVLALPTEALVPFPLSDHPSAVAGREIDPLVGTWATTLAFNMSGHPAMTVPCGWTSEELPVGLQLVGRSFDEAALFQLAGQIEKLNPWMAHYPPPSVRNMS